MMSSRHSSATTWNNGYGMTGATVPELSRTGSNSLEGIPVECRQGGIMSERLVAGPRQNLREMASRAVFWATSKDIGAGSTGAPANIPVHEPDQRRLGRCVQKLPRSWVGCLVK